MAATSTYRQAPVQDPRGATYANVHSPLYGIWTPEIARAITSRWISEVPSKIV